MWAAMFSHAKSFSIKYWNGAEQAAQMVLWDFNRKSAGLSCSSGSGAQQGRSPLYKGQMTPSQIGFGRRSGGMTKAEFQGWVFLSCRHFWWNSSWLTKNPQPARPYQDWVYWGKRGCLPDWDSDFASMLSKQLPVFILKLCWLSWSHACHDNYVQMQAKMT